VKDELATLPEGSRITLTASTVNGATQRPGIQIQVTDNGPGLPQEALRLVFDPFVVRSDTPLEYGIHLMAFISSFTIMAAKIDAQSENGRGTTFTIRLPIDPNSTPAAESDTEFSARSCSAIRCGTS
jgi:K+-sensing histidine kinase KdpD